MTSPGQDSLVSVVVRTVNRPLYLQECLKSIARQTYPHWELILVNDGGPSLRSLVDSLDLPGPVHLIELAENQGRSRAGNIGIDAARGRYLCFLDDDDIFYPYHFETLIEALKGSTARAAYADSLKAMQVPVKADATQYSTTEFHLEYSRSYRPRDIVQGNFIPILCMLLERSCLGSDLRFDPELDVLEDWDLWIRLSERTEFIHVPVITSEYRMRTDGTNTVGQVLNLWLATQDRILRRYDQLRVERLR